jgi:hypothetical protein
MVALRVVCPVVPAQYPITRRVSAEPGSSWICPLSAGIELQGRGSLPSLDRVVHRYTRMSSLTYLPACVLYPCSHSATTQQPVSFALPREPLMTTAYSPRASLAIVSALLMPSIPV